MIDLDNIPTDNELTLKLPQLISADDYHEFAYYEQTLEALGLNVVVQEVAFSENDMYYYGLVHLDTPEHRKLYDQVVEAFELIGADDEES